MNISFRTNFFHVKKLQSEAEKHSKPMNRNFFINSMGKKISIENITILSKLQRRVMLF